MKILVTGGAGFIASHIVDSYIERGDEVVVIDNLSTGKEGNLNPKARFFRMDIQDERIEDIFRDEKFDLVNHQAAQVDVRKSVEDPVFDADTNTLGTINILENCKKYKVKKVVFASSGGVIYGECGSIPAREETSPNPLSPYGITKRVAELYLNYYYNTWDLNYTALRYGNVYGPRQDPMGEAGVIAIFSKSMLEGGDISIFGDGIQLRDYVHVHDVVQANILVSDLKNDKTKGQIFNVGTGESHSVNDLFRLMKEVVGYKREPIYCPPRAGELEVNRLNIEKISRLVGWEPRIDFKQGLEDTVEYFKKGMVKTV